ncbi:MAG: hypothetical protein CMQ27_03080 [Gammaproteobacteria bacterium]|nr:hypothetical protein [Gammaproteobacteria bacterium]|tara:strand:- start:224 stop:613 length:390 start_codon:yes stop_codon:yes gene_type:complete
MCKKFALFPSVNVLGGKLRPCSNDPITGFFRDGFCNTCKEDSASHTVCAEISYDFLAYSKGVGNDLSTPIPQARFPGLNQGDRWCLCAGRWLEAYTHGKAPKIFLENTHKDALKIISLDLFKEFAIKIN